MGYFESLAQQGFQNNLPRSCGAIDPIFPFEAYKTLGEMISDYFYSTTAIG